MNNKNTGFQLVEAIQTDDDWVSYIIAGSGGDPIRGLMRGLLEDVRRQLEHQIHKANARHQLHQVWQTWSWNGSGVKSAAPG